MSASDGVLVTLAEVSRIAGVGRAAVSNWRRRHGSFPTRAGGSDAAPLFSLAEVERWLRDHGKLREAGARELLWPRFEALGSREESGRAIAEAARRMQEAPSGPAPAGLAPAASELAREAARIGRDEGARETFEFLLGRWLDAHVRQLSTTPPQLASLMARVALDARADRREVPLVVLDPACGSGLLLAAAAHAYTGPGLELLGCDRDPSLSSLATARLGFESHARGTRVDVVTADALRADPHQGARADIALCRPPFNDPDWGHEELAADARWTHGLPPRTESELAWVQHLVGRLRPGGAAVVLVPAAVASRRAGRRIRASLVRDGVLRAVVSLPPGCAPPYGSTLLLWVLRAVPEGRAVWAGRPPTAPEGGGRPDAGVLFVDAARFAAPDGHRPGADWAALAAAVHTAVDVLDAPQAPLPVGAARLSPLDLLDEDVDLAPAHRVGPGAGAGPDGTELPASWEELALLLHEGAELSRTLAEFACEKVRSPGTFTLGELVKAGVLTLRAGRQPSDRTGPATDDGLVPLLTVRDVVRGGAPVERVPPASGLAVAEEGDVVVVGTARAFRAWVHSGPPLALGPQLYALRAAPGRLDAHFLAGCLRAPANGRRAGTHVSGAARIDVRRLRVPRLPLDEQELYAEVFRRLSALDGMLTRAGRLGGGLRDELTDLLAAGGRVGSAG